MKGRDGYSSQHRIYMKWVERSYFFKMWTTLVIYKPIETIHKQEEFPEDRKGGHDDYWESFNQQQSQIDRWGERLRCYMKQKSTRRVMVAKHGESTVSILSSLKSKDTVYIHSHGKLHYASLGPYRLNATALAARLEEDGLPKINVPRIKLWACHSGEKETEDEKSTFAYEVGAALYQRGYQNFSIFGYNGKILSIKKTDYLSKKLVRDSQNERIVETASQRRVEYRF